MTELLGLAVAVTVAVGGWVVNGVLARRSARRDLRVTYLLSAYRALDGASNRAAITTSHEHAIESAVADIILLGNDRQVELANAFSKAFADDGHADTSALLEALRADLRKELLLGDAGPRRSWLRIESGTQWAEESARVRARLAGQAIERVGEPPSTATAETSGHVQAIEAAYQDVEATVRQRFPELVGVDATSAPNSAALLGPANAQALEGLAIMRDLAVRSPHRVSAVEVADFVTLAKAVAYAIRTSRTDP
ncbi:MAG: hypothetical protein AB7L13_24390 [Acidimicrobiia bacterium]